MSDWDLNNLLSAAYLLDIAISLGVILIIAGVVQLFFNLKYLNGENSRKLIHILVAVWVAGWRFFLEVPEVVVLGVVLTAAMILIRKFDLFRARILSSIFAIPRTSWGEVTYPLSITLSALLFPEPAVFALAMLNLGLADGLAALIGRKYGKRKYIIFSAQKSLAGFLAALAVLILTSTGFWVYTEPAYSLLPSLILIVMPSFVIASSEFVGVRGLDNALIPLITGLIYTNVI